MECRLKEGFVDLLDAWVDKGTPAPPIKSDWMELGGADKDGVNENEAIAAPELRFLRELVGSNVPFMIVGLSAAALQGAPTVTQDIDLWFKDLAHPGLREALVRVGGAYVPPSVLNPPMFAGAYLELFDIVLRMDGLGGFDEELRQAIDIMLGDCEVKVLPLSRVLVRKKAANRPKGRLVIAVLEDALSTVGPKPAGPQCNGSGDT